MPVLRCRTKTRFRPIAGVPWYGSFGICQAELDHHGERDAPSPGAMAARKVIVAMYCMSRQSGDTRWPWQSQIMKRWSMVALATLLSGCSQSSDSFAVSVDGANALSAALTVCGKTSPLTRDNDGRFSADRRIDCEGDGEVKITLLGGAVVHCPVGYVTNMHQDWAFTINGSRCTPDRNVG